MRTWTLVTLLVVAACGNKKPPEPAVDPPAAAPAPAPAPPAPPAPEEPVAVAPPPPQENTSLSVTVKTAGGSTMDGRLKRIERSTDWWGEEDWSADTKDLSFTAESNGAERSLRWDDVRTLAIKAGGVPDQVDCTYSSEYQPWMYTCELRLEVIASTKDGQALKVTDRHKWRFVFQDGQEVEFWIAKHPARLQDEGERDDENYEMYFKLQDELKQVRTGSLVTSIVVK